MHFMIGRSFQLTSRPTRRHAAPEVVPSPKRTLERFLSLPQWNDDAIQQAERAIEYYWERVTDWSRTELRPCEQDEATEELILATEPAIKEWRRIQTAKPLPSTAYLARHSTIKSHEDRAIDLYVRIQDAISHRKRELDAMMRQFKTSKAQAKEEARVYGSDQPLQRLGAKAEWLQRIEPNIGWLSQVAKRKAS